MIFVMQFFFSLSNLKNICHIRKFFFKGTVGVFLIDSSFVDSVDWRVRFTTLPFKPLTDEECCLYQSTEILAIVDHFFASCFIYEKY